MSQYIDIYNADTYFEGRYNSPLWNPQLSDTVKNQLLITATRLIDSLNFEGTKTVITQALEFPRDNDVDIPQDIKDACCEVAYGLLDGFNPEFEARNLSSPQLSFDRSRINTNTQSLHESRTHGIPSVVAWDKLRCYLRDGSTITLSRVD